MFTFQLFDSFSLLSLVEFLTLTRLALFSARFKRAPYRFLELLLCSSLFSSTPLCIFQLPSPLIIAFLTQCDSCALLWVFCLALFPVMFLQIVSLGNSRAQLGFSQGSQLCAAFWLADENSYSIYFIQISNCLKSKGKSRTDYSVIALYFVVLSHMVKIILPMAN